MPEAATCSGDASAVVPGCRRPAYRRLASPAATASAVSWPTSASARSTTSNPGVRAAPGETIGTSRSDRLLRERYTTTPPCSVPSSTCWRRRVALGTSRTVTPAGSWAAWVAARTSAGDAPETPIGTGPPVVRPPNAKPSTTDNATGATMQVMIMERSRRRRRSSLAVMTPVSRAAPCR